MIGTQRNLEHGVLLLIQPRKNRKQPLLYLSQKNDPGGVGDKVFNEITLVSLNNEGGVNKLINYFNRLFLNDELSEVYERYIKSD